MFGYPPRVRPLAPGQHKRTASQCAERGKSDGKGGERGARVRGGVQSAGNVAVRWISQPKGVGGRFRS